MGAAFRNSSTFNYISEMQSFMLFLDFLTNKGFFENFICNSQFLSMAFYQVRNPIRKNCHETSHSKSIENQNKQAVKNRKSRCDFQKELWGVSKSEQKSLFYILNRQEQKSIIIMPYHINDISLNWTGGKSLELVSCIIFHHLAFFSERECQIS